ncbi:MAG: ParA family protein, partial [Ruaniaceae bacterium]|nr:ParA family protein [Ruaniaceae bacterium]
MVSQSKQWSASGLAHLMHTVHAVHTHYNPHLTIAGILVNHHDAQTTSGAHWLAELTTYATGAGLTVLEPPMPKRVVIADAVESSLGLDQYPGAPADL